MFIFKAVFLLDFIVLSGDIWFVFYQAMHSREPGASLQKCAHTQVAVGARIASYHDEIKVSLPAIWTPSHHLLFTFLHVDLQTKLEAPKPVSLITLIALELIILGVMPTFHCSATSTLLYFIHLYSENVTTLNCSLFSLTVPILICTGGNWICITPVINTRTVCNLSESFLVFVILIV